MAFCTNCGAKLPEGAKFCTECGTKVPVADNPEPKNGNETNPVSPVQGNYPPPFGAETQSGEKKDPWVQAGEPGFTFQGGGKKRNVGLIAGLVVLGVALVAAMIFMIFGMTRFAASGDKGALGRYEGVSCLVSGQDLGAEDEWVELKSGGKASLRLMDETYNGTWTLDGEDITITESGDKYTGTLRDGVMTVDFYGMVYTFAKDGARVPETMPESISESQPESMPETRPEETEDSTIPALVHWWEGDWYGWWILQNGTGDWEDITGNYWDTCARIWVEDDGTGYIEFWDEDNEAGECFANATVTFTTEGTSGKQGAMVCGTGQFWNAKLAERDWAVDPVDRPFGPKVKDGICIEGTYVDPEDSDNSFDYEFYLRPWGTEWEDVRSADTSALRYDNMMPAYYDSWYLPLIRDGVTQAPDLVGEK